MQPTAHEPVRVGLFGVGLDTYWPQFPGLLERLGGYQARIADRLRDLGAHILDTGSHDREHRLVTLVALPDTTWQARQAAGNHPRP
jgi:hypothetical protein